MVKGKDWSFSPINVLIEPEEKVDAGLGHSVGQVNSLVLVFHQANLIVSALVLALIWEAAKRLWKLKEQPWKFCAFNCFQSSLRQHPALIYCSLQVGFLSYWFPRISTWALLTHSPAQRWMSWWSVSPIRKIKKIGKKGWKKEQTRCWKYVDLQSLPKPR